MVAFTHTAESIQELLDLRHSSSIRLEGAYTPGNVQNNLHCTACGHRWQAKVADYIRVRASRCPSCTPHGNAHSTEQMQVRLDSLDTGITLVGEWQTNGRSNTYYCARCDGTWNTAGFDIVSGRNGCPWCATHRSWSYTPREYRALLKERQPRLKAITPYVNAKTKVWFRCDRGHEFENDPRAVLNLKGCPWCPQPPRIMHMSEIVRAQAGNSDIALKCLNKIASKARISFRTCRHKWGEFKLEGTRFKLDGYNKKYAIAIEFHGSYWHGDSKLAWPNADKQSERYKKTIKRDRVIRRHPDVRLLIVIWEGEWLKHPDRVMTRVLDQIAQHKATYPI